MGFTIGIAGEIIGITDRIIIRITFMGYTRSHMGFSIGIASLGLL